MRKIQESSNHCKLSIGCQNIGIVKTVFAHFIVDFGIRCALQANLEARSLFFFLSLGYGNNVNVNVAFLHFHSGFYERNEFKSQFRWILCHELSVSFDIF